MVPSEKYASHQKSLRDNQIKRTEALIDNPSKYSKVNFQDCKIFIKNISYGKNGKIIATKALTFNSLLVEEEA